MTSEDLEAIRGVYVLIRFHTKEIDRLLENIDSVNKDTANRIVMHATNIISMADWIKTSLDS